MIILWDKFTFKLKPLKYNFKFAVICGLPDGRDFHKYFDNQVDDNALWETIVPVPRIIIYGSESVYADQEENYAIS